MPMNISNARCTMYNQVLFCKRYVRAMFHYLFRSVIQPSAVATLYGIYDTDL